MTPKSKILDVVSIDQKIKRLAWQVYEENLSEKEMVIIGISERGLILANRIGPIMQDISKIKIKISQLNLDKDNPYNKDILLDMEVKEYKNSFRLC